MNQRFQNAEIRAVSEQYAENLLYKAVCTIGLQLENELKEFGLCQEECFIETIELLSVIAEKGVDILPELDNIWLRKENEYRRHDRHVNEDEIRKAVGIVFGFAIIAIDSSQNKIYRYKLTEQLTHTVANHKFAGWQNTLGQIFSIPIPDGWFDAFINEEPNIEKETCTERGEFGAKETRFTDFIVDKGKADQVISIIKQKINCNDAKQTAYVIIGGIEAGKINRDVSAPSIEREFGAKGNSVKPYLTKYRSYKDGISSYYSEEELKPYKELFNEI